MSSLWVYPGGSGYYPGGLVVAVDTGIALDKAVVAPSSIVDNGCAGSPPAYSQKAWYVELDRRQ